MKKNSLLLFVFLMTLFSTFTWAACNGTSNGTWTTTSTSYTSSNNNFSADYYTIVVTKTGTINLTVNNTSSGNFTRNLTASLYANSACSSPTIWSSTISKGHSDATTISVSAGTYTLQVVRNNNRQTGYSISGTFTATIPSFSIADVTMNEGSSGMYTKNIPVTLSDANGSSFTVIYATSNGTATNGSDYNATSGTLTFSGSTTTQNIPVKINGDTTNENDKSFYITLSNATGGATIKDNRATITLLNDDGGAVHSGGRDFLIRNPMSTQNIKGNIKVIGNTVLCYKQNGQCVDTDSANNRVSLSYINTNNGYVNSSQAQIAGVPATAKVIWAGFYTQGYMRQGYNQTTSALTNSPAYLITPQGTTIAINPNVIDVNPYDEDYNTFYTYSTFSEVPSLKGMTGSQINGYFTGANIKAIEGKDPGSLGYFGAWSLVIIYESTTESLKNISVFDGYKRVSNDTGYQNVDITVDGFLTPTSGNVNSALSVFVGEGDKNIAGDSIFLNNIQIPDEDNDNAFNSTVNGFTPNPNPINFQGIDIHNYDVGIDGDASHAQIIGNSETSATIRLHTERYTDNSSDTYFPSMVAFTTELYEPRVCYAEAYYDADGNTTLSSANKDDIITVKTWIANMKKDASDGNLETAQKVEITMEQDDTNLAYQTESTKIQNIGETVYSSKTDAQDTDIATFSSDLNTSVWHIGTGATSSDGGYLTPNVTNDATNKVYISFKAKLQTSGDITIANVYKVSYENSSMGLRIGDESPVNIGVCKDFSSSITVSPPLGAFNVVNENFSSNTNSTDVESSDNALYTQIAGQDFTVKVLALDSDNTTLKAYTGDVNLSLISAPTYTGDADSDQALCNGASTLTSNTSITFNNDLLQTISYNFLSAQQNVAFKIGYNNGGITKYVCSRDSFSIRPWGYKIDANETHLVGSKPYELTIQSVQNNKTTKTITYNQTIPTETVDKNASLDLIVPIDCNVSTLNDRHRSLSPLTFSSGEAIDNNFTYPNIGDVNITILDNDWTKNDQNRHNHKGYDDCIVDSNTSIPVAGKIGCLIKSVKPFTFSPKKFTNTLAIQNFNDGNFTYISNDGNMSAVLLFTPTAILENNTTATNYTKRCYAQDINYTVELNGTTQDKRNRIFYIEDENETTSNFENNNTVASAVFSSSEGNFTNGIAANLKMFFNFTRTQNTPDEPFKIAKSDFNITKIIDEQNTTGSDFNRTTDQNVTFYYGRVYSTDYREQSPITTTIRYEVYCKDCNTTDMNITGTQSPTSLKWYQNIMHNSLADGNITQFRSVGTTLVKNLNDTAQSTAIANGFENDNTLTNVNIAPYTDRIQMTPSSWLLYNPFNALAITNDFNVEFISTGNWAGQGQLGETVDVNTSTRTNRRMEW